MEQKFTFKQDWDNDGALTYENAKTLNTYHALNKERDTVDLPRRFNIFCAFSDKQFEEGLKTIRLKEGEKPVRFGMGMFGTREGIKAYIAFLDDVRQRIREQCDPQEVYCYEFNNYESMIAYDGDANAMHLIIDTFGEEAARQIERKCAFYSLDALLSGEDSE